MTDARTCPVSWSGAASGQRGSLLEDLVKAARAESSVLEKVTMSPNGLITKIPTFKSRIPAFLIMFCFVQFCYRFYAPRILSWGLNI